MASYPLQTSGMASARRILARHNLDHEYFCLNNTRGDGNCFFHAIADQLLDGEIQASVGHERAHGVKCDHRDIRQKVVDFARRSQECLEDDTIVNLLLVEDEQAPLRFWTNYCRTMRREGEWATELIVRAAAIFFGKNIRVITDNYIATWEGGQQAADPPMTIVNIGNWHFQSVRRRHGNNAPAPTLNIPRPEQKRPASQLPREAPKMATPSKTGPGQKASTASGSKPAAGAARQMSGADKGVPRQSQARTCSTSGSTPKPVSSASTSAGETSGDILAAPCRNCRKAFKRLLQHLRLKPECMAKYTSGELNKAERRRQSQIKSRA